MKVMTLAVTATMLASSLFAADANYLKGLPRGVQNIKYKDGVISTLMVVGHAAVPKALRKNPGRAAEYSGGEARENATHEFVNFLSTKCKWGKNSEGETVVKEEAASATDAQGKEVSAESSSFSETKMSKEQMAQAALAYVSAIQGIWEGLNDSGEYVWVGAWNAKAAASIKGMAKTMNEAQAEVGNMAKAAKAKKDAVDKKELEAIEGESGSDETGAGEGAGTQKPKKSGDLDILKGMVKPKGTVSQDADEFL